MDPAAGADAARGDLLQRQGLGALELGSALPHPGYPQPPGCYLLASTDSQLLREKGRQAPKAGRSSGAAGTKPGQAGKEAGFLPARWAVIREGMGDVQQAAAWFLWGYRSLGT